MKSHRINRRKTYSLVSLAIVFTLSIISCGAPDKVDIPEEVEAGNLPANPSPPYPSFRSQEFRGEKNFATLINSYTQGKIEPTPWAGYWWPYTKNGIASGGFMDNYSPAGKYDAARGRSTQAQAWEIKMHGAGVPQVQGWWGHCNGWCAAAALFKEPRESVKVNNITFGIADIKALLTEAGMSVSADFFGDRIDNWDDPNSPKYWDTIPNQYFLVLTNYIGKLKQAVLIDRYTGYQVWNQPLSGYKIEYPTPADYLGNTPEAPNVYRINLTTKLWWADDGVAPDVQTPPFNFQEDDAIFGSRELRLELWVDAPVVFDSQGKIVSSGNVIVTRKENALVGGAWKTDNGADSWPDYMWVPYALVKPTNPDEDYVNPEIDIDWIKAHILVPGGADDPSATPGTIEPAPIPRPSGSPFPFPFPTSLPTSLPTNLPWPFPTSTPRPTFTSGTPIPWPRNL
jgi:hypothetical protein